MLIICVFASRTFPCQTFRTTNLTLSNLSIHTMASTAFPVKWIFGSVKPKSSKMKRNSLAADPVCKSRQCTTNVRSLSLAIVGGPGFVTALGSCPFLFSSCVSRDLVLGWWKNNEYNLKSYEEIEVLYMYVFINLVQHI